MTRPDRTADMRSSHTAIQFGRPPRWGKQAVVVVVFDGVGGLLCSPRPEPPMGHMAVLG